MYNIATKTSCPYCSYKRYWKLRRAKYKCKKCRREYSTRSYVAGVTAAADDWQRCLDIFLKQRAVQAVSQETGMSYAKTQKMLTFVRRAMLEDEPPAFSSICEANETFVGGQWKNKRRHIRRSTPARSGQGTFKSPVTGVYSRQLKQVRVRAIEQRTGVLYWAFVRSCLTKNAVLYTDGFKMNRGLKNRFGIAHEYVDHDAGEFVRGDIHTNAIEGFWGYLKRNLASIGGIRRDRLPLFVGEFVWRFNYRTLTHEQRVERLLKLLNNRTIGGNM